MQEDDNSCIGSIEPRGQRGLYFRGFQGFQARSLRVFSVVNTSEGRGACFRRDLDSLAPVPAIRTRVLAYIIRHQEQSVWAKTHALPNFNPEPLTLNRKP